MHNEPTSALISSVCMFAGMALFSLASCMYQPAAQSTATPIAYTAAIAGSCHANGPLPDVACTPGATDPTITQANIQSTICTKGWTKKTRPPVSVTEPIKAERMAAYGVTASKATVELDHVVPLEIGGAPQSIQNLWPEPWNGPENAHVKDSVENASHAAVCSGRMALTDAQSQIAGNWVALCKQLNANPQC